MSERRAPYLRVVRLSDGEAVAGDAAASETAAPEAEVPETAQASVATEKTKRSDALAQAIMHACVGWVRLCMERDCAAVDIQPVAERCYEADMQLLGEGEGEGDPPERPERLLLLVRLELEIGLVVRTVVEPVRP